VSPSAAGGRDAARAGEVGDSPQRRRGRGEERI
jgi:hypothetical protein